jgi:hypothetical protein
LSNLAPPPIQESVVERDGVATLPWILFFNNIFEGDTGTDWTPDFNNLTEAGGAATITGRYIMLTQRLAYFRVTVTPANAGSTSAVAGSTTIDNFPLTFAQNGIVFAVSGLLGTNSGMVNQADNKIYVPTWTTVTIPVTVIGLAEVL